MGSFFRALFDFSFSEFVTTKLIKVLYVITIILAALVWIGILISSLFSRNAWAIIGAIFIVPIGFLIQVIFARVGYEILIVIFGIAESARDMAWALTGGRKAPPATPQPPQYGQPQYGQPQYPPQAPQQYPQYPPQGGQMSPQQPPQYPQYPPQPK
jgi:hypothetical protein